MNFAPKKREEPIAPSELWVALTAVPRPTRDVPVPRQKENSDEFVGTVSIWPLTQEEMMAANAEADRFTRALMKDPQKKEEANLGYHYNYTNEVAIQVLFRACRVVGDLKRAAFPSPPAMRAEFTTDEIGVLFDNYCTIQAEVGPIVAHMDAAEYEALVVRLQEGGSAIPFDSLSWEQRRALVLFMASRLASCWMAMSSRGLPLDVGPYAEQWIRGRLEAEAEEEAKVKAGDDDLAPGGEDVPGGPPNTAIAAPGAPQDALPPEEG